MPSARGWLGVVWSTRSAEGVVGEGWLTALLMCGMSVVVVAGVDVGVGTGIVLSASVIVVAATGSTV